MVRFFATVVFSPRHTSKLVCARLIENVRFFKTVVFSHPVRWQAGRHTSKLSICALSAGRRACPPTGGSAYRKRSIRTAMKLSSFVITIACCLLLGACSGNGGGNAGSGEYEDDYGRCVVVPQKPSRIVSLSPSITEIIFSLDAGDLLVGRTDYCDYPPQVSQIPSVGGISNLSIEHVVSLMPDLVISGSMVSKKNVEALERMGIPVVCVIEKHSFDGLYQNVRSVGQLIGKQDAAEALCIQMDNQLRLINEKWPMPDNFRPSIYYAIGFGSSGNFTAGGNSYINDMLTLAGGRNIAADVEGWSYSVELLMSQNPDYIVIRKEEAETFCKTRPYTSLSAVRNNRVIPIPSGWMDGLAPRNFKAIEAIRKVIYT
ncbi:MAG: ABC transporter substrate-binding protein, partial [Bacteroidales bacterium]|nr:ABC transporter substrate-binding protein [Candidatus Colimorpha onthohippi]